MDNTEQAAERGLPDLREKIDIAVGHLTVMAQSLRTGRPLLVKDADALETAMLLLAGLQEVVAWEPGDYRFTPQGSAEQLRVMAAIGTRPPAVVTLLLEAAGHLQIAQYAQDEALVNQLFAVPPPAEDLANLLLTAERDAYDLAEQSMAAARRLAQLHARVVAL